MDHHSMEELGAEILEYHIEDIIKLGKKLYNSLKIQAEKLKLEKDFYE